MNNIMNKKIVKVFLLLLFFMLSLIFILNVNMTKIEINPTYKSEIKEILETIPIEYEVKTISDDTYKIVVTINSEKGIENIKFKNTLGEDVELNCGNKQTVAIDYEVKENQEYYFLVKRVGEPVATEKIFIERAVYQDGTKEYPYIIKTADQLQKVNNKLDVYYRLGANIELNGREWQQIGSETQPFKGELNGNGYTIKNLSINKAENNVGLFGYSQGTLKNIKLSNFNVTGKDNVGALVGYSTGNISGISVDAKVKGETNVGGLAGYTYSTNKDLTIEQSSASRNYRWNLKCWWINWI